jgi:23S rRNA pseudouridine1911/1915/1917 synthase
VTEREAGRRLDVFLASKLEGVSRSLIRKHIDDGERAVVRVNSRPQKAHYRLREGDVIAVRVPPPKETKLVPREMPLSILYEDEEIIVVNKGPGVPVHPGAGHGNDTIVNALLHYSGTAGSLSDIGGENRPGIIHRLDKDTAGVLLVAKTNAAHAHLSLQFHNRTTEKLYEAIVKGRLVPAEGVIDGPIARCPYNRKKFSVAEHGREAVTAYRVVDSKNDTSYVRFFPKTGRTHQIRVHAAHVGHPILGDPLYSRKAREVRYLALLARQITVVHPKTGERMTFTAPYPRYFRDLATECGYTLPDASMK